MEDWAWTMAYGILNMEYGMWNVQCGMDASKGPLSGKQRTVRQAKDRCQASQGQSGKQRWITSNKYGFLLVFEAVHVQQTEPIVEHVFCFFTFLILYPNRFRFTTEP